MKAIFTFSIVSLIVLFSHAEPTSICGVRIKCFKGYASCSGEAVRAECGEQGHSYVCHSDNGTKETSSIQYICCTKSGSALSTWSAEIAKAECVTAGSPTFDQ